MLKVINITRGLLTHMYDPIEKFSLQLMMENTQKDALMLFYRSISLTKSELADISFDHEKAIQFELSYYDCIKELDYFKEKALYDFSGDALDSENEINQKALILEAHFNQNQALLNEIENLYPLFLSQFKQAKLDYEKLNELVATIEKNEGKKINKQLSPMTVSPCRFFVNFYHYFQPINLDLRQKTILFLIATKNYFSLLIALFNKTQIHYFRMMENSKRKFSFQEIDSDEKEQTISFIQELRNEQDHEQDYFQEAIEDLFSQFDASSLKLTFINAIKGYWVNLLKLIHIRYGFHSKEWGIAVKCLCYFIRSTYETYLFENEKIWTYEIKTLKSDLDFLSEQMPADKKALAQMLRSLLSIHIQIRKKFCSASALKYQSKWLRSA